MIYNEKKSPFKNKKDTKLLIFNIKLLDVYVNLGEINHGFKEIFEPQEEIPRFAILYRKLLEFPEKIIYFICKKTKPH